MSSRGSPHRLMREIAQLEQDPPPGIAAWTEKDSMYQMKAQICGPIDSPYENGVFKISMNIPETYPFDPPQVTFVTRIYHPNIDEQGRVCLDTLNLPPKGSWTPTVTLSSLLTTISQLMAYPNADDGLVRSVTEVCRDDPEKFKSIAREWTKKYAISQTSENNGNVSNTKSSTDVATSSTMQQNDSQAINSANQQASNVQAQEDAKDDQSNKVDQPTNQPKVVRSVPAARARPVISDSEDSDDEDTNAKRAKV